jgi:riboflavin synthase
MFTGLIADVGSVERIDSGAEGARLRIATSLAAELERGDSVAVNGVCLTAAEVDGTAFEADVMAQTLRLTSLGSLAEGGRVNIELPLRPSDRLGGHVVQGHVDGTAEVADAGEDGFARRLRLAAEPGLLRYVVERGSVALDGVSLTVAATGDGWFEVSLIPETLERTNLADAAPGRVLNVESDLLAKYVERFAATTRQNG